jgi:hypothetical protein
MRRSLSQSSSRKLIWSRPVSVARTAAFQSSRKAVVAGLRRSAISPPLNIAKAGGSGLRQNL